MKVTKTRAQPKFSDDPEVVHETSGISTTEQSRLPPDTSEALFDDDEETRAIQGEQTRFTRGCRNTWWPEAKPYQKSLYSKFEKVANYFNIFI
jgi:hypothetical protein